MRMVYKAKKLTNNFILQNKIIKCVPFLSKEDEFQ